MYGCEKKITVDGMPADGIGKCRNASEWKLMCNLVYAV